MSEETSAQGGIIIMIMLAIYMICGAFFESSQACFGHEASVIIIVAASVSFLCYSFGQEELVNLVAFDETYFFYFCLPPIVFASGFNMKRKKFFENFTNVIIFGVISTILQFFAFILAICNGNSAYVFTDVQ